MSLLPGSAIPLSGYDINNSLRFRSIATAFLSRTPASAGSRTTWTWSAWVKRGSLGTEQFLFTGGNTNFNDNNIRFNADNTLTFNNYNGVNADAGVLTTSRVFRDPSAWYHIVAVWNTTTATAADRMQLWINGVRETVFSANANPVQNQQSFNINNNVIHNIGRKANGATSYFDGYITEMNFIDGQALTPSSFGETDTTTGVWKPKAYTGTYGTNGFYQKYSSIALTSGSNTGLGQDFSGNGNFWNTNNISVTAGTTYDAMTDSPTLTSETVANYCVMNPISEVRTITINNGNLGLFSATLGQQAIGTIGVSSGKYYWEASTNAGTTQARAAVYSTTASTRYSFAANNTVYGFRFDADAGTFDVTSDGTNWTSVATGLTSGPYFPFFSNNGTTSKTISVNFGQRPFTHTPPAGYSRLNTFNLPDSTIKKGNSYMDATLYTGTGSTQSITNAGSFRPDFVWIKSRSSGAAYHNLYDSVRGVTKQLFSNVTDAEATNANSLTSFNANGFSVGVDTGTGNFGWNTNAVTYVGWQWQAGSSTVTNTSGTISAQVRANPTAGFSIVTYTGTGSAASIGHGLGIGPEFIIIKRRNATANWMVVSRYLTNYNWYLKLNLTDAQVGDATIGNIDPTPTIFNVGTNAIDNASGGTYVAYVWAPIAGFSKFGSYTGNGNADGPFVYLGFRPKFVIVKNASVASDWVIIDSSRDTFNVAPSILQPNLSNAQTTGTSTNSIMDLLSNGFKMRGTGGSGNGNGNTIIYAAFAENPFKNALAR